ncbi:hypothetical protein CK203_076959 [Vitis vinifera]|uniref:Uncharacterized protein n=1 Tax=Vitis vinifera TaxID=29760 RepID=A0A438E046_VITVI|nr:hypothetical protein CK203_076959 [Vitis vinifera]
MAVISRKRLELAARKLRSRSSCRVPHGYVPMYVGEEHKLYEVPVECLSSVMLQALLIQFEEEIPANGPIALSCSLQMFEWVMVSPWLRRLVTSCEEFLSILRT